MPNKKTLHIVVAGFKYGLPRANNIVDVSFLANPGREFGLDSETDARHEEFIRNLELTNPLLDALVTLSRVIISANDAPMLAICCNRGSHRSPIIARLLARRLETEGHLCEITYLDGEK